MTKLKINLNNINSYLSFDKRYDAYWTILSVLLGHFIYLYGVNCLIKLTKSMSVHLIFLKILLVPIYACKISSIFLFLFMGRVDKISHISLNHFHQLFCHWSWVIHAWTHVDLYYPGIEVFVYHEIVANHLKEPFFTCYTAFASFDAPNYNIFYFLLDSLPILLPYKLSKSFHVPHTIVDYCTFMIFLNRIIGQMHEFIVNIV